MKRKYRLRSTGRLPIESVAKSTSKFIRLSSGETTMETVRRIVTPIGEKAVIYRGKGRWRWKKHPEGYYFPWRDPSNYNRGHVVIDIAPSSDAANWSNIRSKGTVTYNGPISRNLTNLGDWTKFIGNRSSMSPLVRYNELARNNVAIRMKVKNAKFNLSIFAAEFKKSVGTLAAGTRDFIGIYRNVKRGNFKGAIKYFRPADREGNRKGKFSSKDVAVRWMELQYGWRPIINDIAGAYEYIMENHEKLMTYSVSANFKEAVPKHTIFTGRNGDILEAEGSRGFRTKVHYLIDLPALRESSRLGLLNPLQVGWDLLPFSFVVDWFIPVANMLEALDATVGTRFISGTRTGWCDIDLTGQSSSEYFSFNEAHFEYPIIPVTGKIYSIERKVLYGYPMVLPYVKNPFSASHFATALSLVRILTGRK
ncbi:MAG: putative maturation protein [Perrunavirus faecivivens]|uniref:Maturation protein n=1 Tax=Leviviridae sp. TaxID=2027243 RepID=A0ABY3SUH7_9VIRU|nr:MAG: putative maturation protein [Leviviridae sp.]